MSDLRWLSTRFSPAPRRDGFLLAGSATAVSRPGARPRGSVAREALRRYEGGTTVIALTVESDRPPASVTVNRTRLSPAPEKMNPSV